MTFSTVFKIVSSRLLRANLKATQFAKSWVAFAFLSMSLIPDSRCLCDEPFEQSTQSVEGRRSAWERVRRAACAIARSAPNLKGRTGAAGQRRS